METTTAKTSKMRFEEVQRKYNEEREKRLRSDGESQYTSIKQAARSNQRLKSMIENPWTKAMMREPVTDDVEVAIIGGGFAGVCAAARLRLAGIPASDIRIIDAAGDVGGTWYWNRYPGAQCDIEAYIYLPFCEELGYTPTEKYSHQPEIMAHAQAIMHHYGLYEKACFGAEVTSMKWQDAIGKWTIATKIGDTFCAKFAIVTWGTFGEPKLPDIPGIADFKGHIFHTARWDYDYTGGSSAGGLEGLADKRVAIIGTGATAVQVVPHLGEHAKELYVVQRTPSGVAVRGNRETTPDFARDHLSKPGWHEQRRMNFLDIMSWPNLLGRPEQENLKVDLIQDGWTKISEPIRKIFESGKSPTGKDIMKIYNPAGWLHTLQEDVRARCDELVTDKKTAEALKPYYALFCKRPCFHDEYLQTFNRPNVKLLDTDGKGLERVTQDGIIANGQEVTVDCIIMSTGFEVQRGGQNFASKLGFDLVGTAGLKLQERWSDGARTLNGLNVHGFPNMWMISSPHSGTFIANVTMGADLTATHIAHVIATLRQQGLNYVEPTAEAEKKFCDWIVDSPMPQTMADGSCTPGYYNAEGQMSEENPLNVLYPKGVRSYFAMLHKMRNEGKTLSGLRTDSLAPLVSKL